MSKIAIIAIGVIVVAVISLGAILNQVEKEGKKTMKNIKNTEIAGEEIRKNAMTSSINLLLAVIVGIVIVIGTVFFLVIGIFLRRERVY